LADREAANRELVALIGYPAYDPRNDADAMHRYFNDLYDVKRFAPGLILKATADAVLSHDCTSLGGSSGSTLMSLEQKKAVGLHFAGVYGKENSAVGVDTIKKLLHGFLVTVGADSRRRSSRGGRRWGAQSSRPCPSQWIQPGFPGRWHVGAVAEAAGG